MIRTDQPARLGGEDSALDKFSGESIACALALRSIGDAHVERRIDLRAAEAARVT